MNLQGMKSLSPEKQKELFNRLSSVRKKAKVVTYSAVYGVGKQKLSRETGMSVREAGALLDAYWKRNWAVKKVADQQYKKEVGKYQWVKNPVSGFWHELRYEKDTWSTVNQSTGVFIFDSWLARCRLYGYMGQMQFHDETGSSVADKSRTQRIMEAAVEKLNDDLTLNVTIGIDVKFGANYAEVH